MPLSIHGKYSAVWRDKCYVIWALRVFCSVLKMNVGERNKESFPKHSCQGSRECFTVQLLKAHIIFICVFARIIQLPFKILILSETAVGLSFLMELWTHGPPVFLWQCPVYFQECKESSWRKDEMGRNVCFDLLFCSPYLRLRCKEEDLGWLWEEKKKRNERLDFFKKCW